MLCFASRRRYHTGELYSECTLIYETVTERRERGQKMSRSHRIPSSLVAYISETTRPIYLNFRTPTGSQVQLIVLKFQN